MQQLIWLQVEGLTKAQGGDLEYPETVVYQDEAIVPVGLIVYRKTPAVSTNTQPGQNYRKTPAASTNTQPRKNYRRTPVVSTNTQPRRYLSKTPAVSTNTQSWQNKASKWSRMKDFFLKILVGDRHSAGLR